eukprot:3384811-Lingulodinium_polyedra.AAC.1
MPATPGGLDWPAYSWVGAGSPSRAGRGWRHCRSSAECRWSLGCHSPSGCHLTLGCHSPRLLAPRA